jgi:hypothetical protein
MSKAEQFREFADEAFQWSRKAKTEAARQILLGLAFTWIQAALISERTLCGILGGCGFIEAAGLVRHLCTPSLWPRPLCKDRLDRRRGVFCPHRPASHANSCTMIRLR